MSKAGFSPYDIGLCDTINETNHLLQRIRTGDYLFFPYQRELDWNNPGLPLPLQANLMGYCYRIMDIRYGSYSSREVYRLPSLTGKNIMDQTIRELIELHCLPLSFYSTDANKVFTLPFPYIPRFVRPVSFHQGQPDEGYIVKPCPGYFTLADQQLHQLHNEIAEYQLREARQLQSFQR